MSSPEGMPAADLLVMVTNLRVSTADTGVFAWLLGGRRRRAVRLLRRHNPDVILAQECDETQTPYVARKLGMAVVKPTAGNRPVFYRQEVLRLVSSKWADVGGRSYCHAALLDAQGARAWYVSLHLSTDATERRSQLIRLQAWLADLAQVCPNVVVGGDFNQSPVSLPGHMDVRGMVPAVGNREANSLHGWREQRWDGRWIDWLFLRGTITARFADLLLTSDLDESDHNWIVAGLTVTGGAVDTR